MFHIRRKLAQTAGLIMLGVDIGASLFNSSVYTSVFVYTTQVQDYKLFLPNGFNVTADVVLDSASTARYNIH